MARKILVCPNSASVSDGVLTIETSWDGEPFGMVDSYLTISSPSVFTLSVYNETKNWNGKIEYSVNKAVWTEWDGSTTITAETYGSDYCIFIRGFGNTTLTGHNSDCSWVLDGSYIEFQGDIGCLLHSPNARKMKESEVDPYGCASLFSGNNGIINTPTMKYVTLSMGCFAHMFEDCVGIESCSALPQLVLAEDCYYSMFARCTSLATLPELPSIVLLSGCYATMFDGCSEIKLSALQEGDYQNAYRIPARGSAIGGPTAVAYMFASTGGTVTDIAVNTTYYTSNSIVS